MWFSVAQQVTDSEGMREVKLLRKNRIGSTWREDWHEMAAAAAAKPMHDSRYCVPHFQLLLLQLSPLLIPSRYQPSVMVTDTFRRSLPSRLYKMLGELYCVTANVSPRRARDSVSVMLISLSFRLLRFYFAFGAGDSVSAMLISLFFRLLRFYFVFGASVYACVFLGTSFCFLPPMVWCASIGAEWGGKERSGASFLVRLNDMPICSIWCFPPRLHWVEGSGSFSS